MLQYLPTGNFKKKLINQQVMTQKKNTKTIVESRKGLILKVDFEYPKELHDLHNDYPCALEKVSN